MLCRAVPDEARAECGGEVSRPCGLVGIAAFLTSLTHYRWWFESPLVRE